MSRPLPRLLLSALLIAATAAFLPPYATSRADISGNESTTTSLSSGLTGFSAADIATLQTTYATTNTQITTKKAEAAALKARLDAADPTASQTDYILLQQEIIDLQEKASSLQTLLAQIDTSTTSTSGSGTSNNSGKGSSSGSSNSMMDALKSGGIQAIAQSLFGGSQGGIGSLGSALGGFNNTAALNSGNVQTGTASGSTGSVAKPDTSQTAGKGDTTPAPDDKSCGTPAVPDRDDSGKLANRGTTAAAAATAALPDRDDSGKIINRGTTAAANANASLPERDDSGKVISKTAADKIAATKKPDCVGVNYTQKDPGGAATAPHGSKITSLEDMQAQIAAMNGQCVSDSKSSAANSCECPSLVKANSNLGPTSGWTKGNQVWGDTDLAIGTPIATFCKGSSSYVNGQDAYGCSHTGLYAGQDANNLYVYNQFNSSNGPKISKIPKNAWNGHPEEGGVKFYTIAGGDAFLFGIPYYVQYTLRALSVWPEGEGLAKSTNNAYNVL